MTSPLSGDGNAPRPEGATVGRAIDRGIDALEERVTYLVALLADPSLIELADPATLKDRLGHDRDALGTLRWMRQDWANGSGDW